MNLRTKVSTIISIVAYLNGVLAGFDPSILGDNPRIQAVYRVFSAVFALAAWINSHYYNQDFTEEACIATGEMRARKAVKAGEYEGEEFFTKYDVIEGSRDDDSDI